MRIVMSKDLKYHFLNLSLDQYGNIDRILELQQYENAIVADWLRLMSSASLVADEVSEFSPSFSQLAAKTGQFSDGVAVLRDGLLGVSGKTGMPVLLVDKQRRQRFIRKGLKDATTRFREKNDANDALELDFVEEFVENITPAPTHLPLPGALFLSSDPVLTSAHLYTLHQVSKDHTLALLALAGIEIPFPAIFIHEDPMTGEVRKACQKELAAFRHKLSEVVEYSYKGLQAGSFKDVYHHAHDAKHDLWAQTEALEEAIRQSDPKLLEKVTIGTDEKTPCITPAYVEPRNVDRRPSSVNILRIISDIIAQNLPFSRCHRLLPSMTYAYHFMKKVKRKG